MVTHEQSEWMGEEQVLDAPPLQPLADRYVRLYYGTKWIAVKAKVPHTEHWIRTRRAQVWQAFKNLGVPTSFVTFTFKNAEVPEDRHDIEKWMSENWNRFMTRLQRYLGFRPKVIRVLDYGEQNGRVHYHCAFWGLPFMEGHWWHGFWRVGYVHAEKPMAYEELQRVLGYNLSKIPPEVIRFYIRKDEVVRNLLSRLAGYLIKYLVKSGEVLEERPKHIRLFSPSRGICDNAEWKIQKREEDYFENYARELLGMTNKCSYYDRSGRFVPEDNTNDLWDELTKWKYLDSVDQGDEVALMGRWTPEEAFFEYLDTGGENEPIVGSLKLSGELAPWEIDFLKSREPDESDIIRTEAEYVSYVLDPQDQKWYFRKKRKRERLAKEREEAVPNWA